MDRSGRVPERPGSHHLSGNQPNPQISRLQPNRFSDEVLDRLRMKLGNPSDEEIVEKYGKREGNPVTGEASRKQTKLKYLANQIKGRGKEMLAIIRMAGSFFFSQTAKDPKEDEIERDEKGVAIDQPIILVHGFLHNSSGWGMHRKKLREAGRKNVFTIDLDGLLAGARSVEEYAEILGKKIEEVKGVTGRSDVQLVGHSMGGLVSSYYALYLAEKSGINVTDVVTLNSPLQGTKRAFIGRFVFLGKSPCAKEMAFHSDFVNRLGGRIAEASKDPDAKTKFYHIASMADDIVRPYFSQLDVSSEEAAKQRNPETTYIADDLGHVGVLVDKKVIEKEIEYLSRRKGSR